MPGPAKGRGGRPPKPVEQKRRTGNPGKRPLPARTQLAAVPAIEPADHERPVEDVIDRILSIGVTWISATDAAKVALLREVAGLYAEARDRPGTPARDLLAYVKTLNDLLSDLGFDPSARSRLGLAEVKTLSAAEKIIQKRAARSS